MIYFYYILLAVISYFIGNVNFARVVAKVKHDDITKYGSGNPGTLNTWRAFGFWAGIATFLLDMLKGVVACLIGYFVMPLLGCNAEIALYVAGFSVVLGHIFPIIFKFKGGKGIATSVGVFLVANWWVALIALAVMIVGMLFIKYASIFTIGYVIAMCIVEICVCNPVNWLNYLFICGILLLVIYAHRANIVRLFEGKENKTELLKMLKGLGKKKDKKIVIEDAQQQTDVEKQNEEK